MIAPKLRRDYFERDEDFVIVARIPTRVDSLRNRVGIESTIALWNVGRKNGRLDYRAPPNTSHKKRRDNDFQVVEKMCQKKVQRIRKEKESQGKGPVGSEGVSGEEKERESERGELGKFTSLQVYGMETHEESEVESLNQLCMVLQIHT